MTQPFSLLERFVTAVEKIAENLAPQEVTMKEPRLSPTFSDHSDAFNMPDDLPGPPPPPATDAEEESGGEAPVDIDDEGFPWDERIHTKAQTRVKKNNTWKLIRQVDPDLVKQVRAEWVAKGFGPQTAPTEQSAPAATEPPEPPAPPNTEATLSFPDFINLLNQAGYTAETTDPVLEKHGITGGAPMLIDKPELRVTIAKELGLI